MTNKDTLTAMSAEDMGSVLCRHICVALEAADKHPCDFCPMTDLCKSGRNGYVAWLEQETDGTI